MMGWRRPVAAAVAAAGAALASTATAVLASPQGTAPDELDPTAAIAHSQAAVGNTIGDYALRDSRSRPVRLADYRGRPLVVNLVYTGCTETCPIVVQTLSRAVEVAQDALGEDTFSVVTVGFDADDDTPARMRAFARRQGVDLPRWRFLSADAATVRALADDLGFIFFPSAKGYDHLAQTTIVDGNGRVYRQVYGPTFKPPALVEPLKRLVFGQGAELASVAGLIDRIRLFCTLYDPASGRYRFDYSIFIGGFVGLASLSALAVILIRTVLRSRRVRRTKASA